MLTRHTAFVALVLSLTIACGDGTQAFDPSPESLCDALVACTPTLGRDACLTSAQPEFDEATMRGCVPEANAANACTVRGLSSDGGTCDTAMLPMLCMAPYDAYRACIVAAGGGGGDPSCYVNTASNHSCSTYPAGVDTTMLCMAQMGTTMASCPSMPSFGRCTFGSATTLDYYAPMLLPLEQYEMICTMNSGVWSTP